MQKGDKINKLTFIEYGEPRIRRNGVKRKMGIYKCDCGVLVTANYYSVKAGTPKQCRQCGFKSISKSKTTHGLIKHPLYRKWQDMKNRCYNPKVDRYNRYGGLGIEVCKEWRNDFKSFYDWAISNGWKKGLTIEREDVKGNYTPSNCKFITHVEQGFNKRNTFFADYQGVKIPLARVLYENNKSKLYSTIWHGLRDGRTFEYYVDKYLINIEKYKQLNK